MEYKVEQIRLIDYLKSGAKELIAKISGKKEQTDIADMDGISEDTRKLLLESLKKIEDNANAFQNESFGTGEIKKSPRTGRGRKSIPTTESQLSMEENVAQPRRTGGREID